MKTSDSTNLVRSYAFETRPLVWVLLENPHATQIKPLEFLALIDTGATQTIIPASTCQRLNHSFEAGTHASLASGIGSGTVRTFAHATRLTILEAAGHELSTPQLPAFPPLEMQIEYVEQNLPFILLGQCDFLKLFRYTQDGQQGTFTLQMIE